MVTLLFCNCLSPIIVHLRNLFFEHICSSNAVNSKVGRQTKRCGILSINISKLKVRIKHSISPTAMFFPNPSFLYTLIWSELNHIAICLSNKELGFIFLLNRLVVYSLPAAMTAAISSVTENHTMDWFYLLKKNFKNLLFDSLMTRKSLESLSYLASCSLSQRWRFRRICSKVLRGIESDLAYKKVLGVSSQYILLSGSMWHPLSSSMLKNSEIFH